MIHIHYLAVILSAIVAMVLGGLWYGPFFGKRWIALMGFTPVKMAQARAKGMTKSYALMALGALLMAFVTAHAVIFADAYMQISGFWAGVFVGVMNWLGFVAPVTSGMVLWEGKPWRLWAIVAGYYLVSLVLMGIILTVWM